MSRNYCMFVGVLLCLLGTAHAGRLAEPAKNEPERRFVELLLRSHPEQAYRLPAMSFFTDSTPALNDRGDLAIVLKSYNGQGVGALWTGTVKGGRIRQVFSDDMHSSDAKLDAKGTVVWELFGEAGSKGVFGMSQSATAPVLLAPPGGEHGLFFLAYPSLNDRGQLAFRGRSPRGQAVYIQQRGKQHLVVGDADEVEGSPYSFVFTPAQSPSGSVAAKVRRGASGKFAETQPDEIRVFALGGKSTLIARDRDADAESPYLSFDNSVAMNKRGEVAFSAALPDGGSGIFRSDGRHTVLIASSQRGDLAKVEPFAPSINSRGAVAFRGIDKQGRRAIFVGDGVVLQRIATAGDLIPTDLGQGRIAQHDDSPVFGAGVSINSEGAVAFNAGLTPADDTTVEWGSGLFLMRFSPELKGKR